MNLDWSHATLGQALEFDGRVKELTRLGSIPDRLLAVRAGRASQWAVDAAQHGSWRHRVECFAAAAYVAEIRRREAL